MSIEPANASRQRGKSSHQHIERSLLYEQAWSSVCPPCLLLAYCMHDNQFMARMYLIILKRSVERIQDRGNPGDRAHTGKIGSLGADGDERHGEYHIPGNRVYLDQ